MQARLVSPQAPQNTVVFDSQYPTHIESAEQRPGHPVGDSQPHVAEGEVAATRANAETRMNACTCNVVLVLMCDQAKYAVLGFFGLESIAEVTLRSSSQICPQKIGAIRTETTKPTKALRRIARFPFGPVGKLVHSKDLGYPKRRARNCPKSAFDDHETLTNHVLQPRISSKPRSTESKYVVLNFVLAPHNIQ
ncbi:hypothetical protein DFH06DRAFT_1146671 [Mycena polygramma]|nr:hypothetical protein DFH06DRAFT_1146671 [Mycena polygramma]